MDPITAKLMSAAGAAADPVYVDDVFSTHVYVGSGSTLTIDNGIDLSGEGGMVWLARRTIGSSGGDQTHWTVDTERGGSKYLSTRSTDGQNNDASLITSFNNNGFSLGNTYANQDDNLVAWTFRKCPGFFDVVTYTGDGNASKTISHSLGSAPGFVAVKRTDTSGMGWYCYHRGLYEANKKFVRLESTMAAYSFNNNDFWGVSSTDFTVYGATTDTNLNGATYVAYLFAHDDQSFGEDGDEAIIKCGSYNPGQSATTVDLGFEPQWVLIKNADNGSGYANWAIFDNMRGVVTGGSEKALGANLNAAEGGGNLLGSNNFIDFTSTGFIADPGNSQYTMVNSGNAMIYVAIRRSHKPPSAGTDVFNADYEFGTNTGVRGYLGHPADMNIIHSGNNANNSFLRLRMSAGNYIYTSSNNAAVTQTLNWWDNMLGFNESGDTGTQNTNSIYHVFRRARGFFDYVFYEGTGSTLNVTHNLGVTPDLIIAKRHDGSSQWVVVRSSDFSVGLQLQNDNDEYNLGVNIFGTPTATTFSPHPGSGMNSSGEKYFALLFATLSGISKVGTYSGTGNNINVDCGFTAGARYVLIKRTDAVSTGDWYVWDSNQGIVSGNDPYIRLNVGGASPVTGTDYIDPLNAGFTVTSSAPAALNTSGGTYLFFAIA